MKKILIKLLQIILRPLGFKGYSVSLTYNALKRDILNKDIPLSTKLWAWRRGFTGTRVYTYGIDESNYKIHMPDFDYYKLHPINGKYSSWIDDKLTTKYILSPFNEYMPKYYFHIKEGELLRLMDCPEDINSDIDGIIDLIKRDGDLALKLLAGSLGAGFYRLTYKNDNFYVNTKETSLTELKKIIESLKGYLVTEYITSHKEIRKIYDVTPNTLRVQVIRDKNKNPEVIGSHIRFGTKKSGVLETPTAGGIIAKVNISNGYVSEANIILNSELESLENHPDSGSSFKFNLPMWDFIVEKIYLICDYVPQLNYLGFDIIITESGFKIIEINSLSALRALPYYYPFFKNDYCREFFIRKFKENPKYFKRVLKMLDEY